MQFVGAPSELAPHAGLSLVDAPSVRFSVHDRKAPSPDRPKVAGTRRRVETVAVIDDLDQQPLFVELAS